MPEDRRPDRIRTTNSEPLAPVLPLHHRRTDLLELISLLRLATKARLKYYNKTTLQELDTEKEILKALMRQANKTVFVDKKGEQRRLLSNHSYGVWAEKMVEIGKLIGGWIQSINKEKQERNRDGKD